MKSLKIIAGAILVIIGISGAPVSMGISVFAFLIPGAKLISSALEDK